MTSHESPKEPKEFAELIVAATEAFTAMSEEPYASDKLEDAFAGIEKALEVGVKEGAVSAADSFEQLAEIAGQANTIAASNNDLTTADVFAGKQSAFVKVVETLRSQEESTEPTDTSKKEMKKPKADS